MRERFPFWIKACCLSQGKEGELLSLFWEGDPPSHGEYWEACAVLSHACALSSGSLLTFKCKDLNRISSLEDTCPHHSVFFPHVLLGS